MPCKIFREVSWLAAVQKKAGGIIATGSRAVAYVGANKEIAVAEKVAERGICGVEGDLFHRKDIGTKKLIDFRIRNMRTLLR